MMGADLVLTGGTVLTMAGSGRDDRAAEPVPTAVAIRGGQIVAVGPDAAVTPWLTRDTRRIDLAGRYVLPGFTDTHTHLATDAHTAMKDRAECRDFYDPSIRSCADILNRMRSAAAGAPAGQLIVGTASPMQELRMIERRHITSAELTEALPDHPAFVTYGAHVLVANEKAIVAAGVGESPADPQGGVFERHDDGTITGVVRERAQIPFKALENTGDFEAYKSAIERSLLIAAKRGVTTIHDIVKGRDELRAYQELDREGRLPVRVQMIIRVIESEFEKWSLLDLGFQHELGNDRLRIGGIKMSIDGGFTGRQSLFRPIENEPAGRHPLIRIQQDELDDTVKKYHDAGMRLCVHASGALAGEMILESYKRTFGGKDVSEHRHRVEHLGNYLMTGEMRKVARDMGIIPVPNPSMFHHLAAEAVQTLGEERTVDASWAPFPIRDLLDEGMPFAPGADSPGYWPVDPLRDAAVCVSRRSITGVSFAPDQAIDPAEAVTAITRTGAYLGFVEDRLGTVREGKLADLVVVPSDPRADGEAMGTVPVDLTINDGRVVGGRDHQSGSDTTSTEGRTS